MNLIRNVTRRFDYMVESIIYRFMDPGLALVAPVPLQRHLVQNCDNWLNPSILWNTPRRRRCLEKRQTRRFGSLEWGTYKLPRINQKIRVDHKTGEYFELGKLAPLTYTRIMEETKAIQKKMQETFGTGTPKDQDVVVLYKGEQTQVPDKYRIVEMERERPSFFSSNLLQKTRAIEAGQTVKPSSLV
ncbi:39S ribosomal protein L32, mitochondrial [Eurytemora carolleeae]|uniref:39S ribosomal protein L32, mitochondrial n=1 Tax=Eurytemora carolleeae TaxID=1294199 RepID=UPI000C77333C|nr:39S ribosomal protein L32, mitochondrial [Eurytemora carolleeae]|eukprot:XP_023338684.1 39S ribosomal protein L32, mitochondrial-like [Eurytemora affinis]